jgi:hypothetical protein
VVKCYEDRRKEFYAKQAREFGERIREEYMAITARGERWKE